MKTYNLHIQLYFKMTTKIKVEPEETDFLIDVVRLVKESTVAYL